MKALRIGGILMLLWAYGMNVHAVIGAWREASPQSTVHSPQEPAHDEHATHGAAGEQHEPEPARAPLPKWRIVLTALLLLAGAVLALGPIAQGKLWGSQATLLVLLAIAVPRIATDPRCWVAYDPTKHGCHTFMISLMLAGIGVGLAAVGAKREAATSG